MTKAELIAKLADLPDDAPVHLDLGEGLEFSDYDIDVDAGEDSGEPIHSPFATITVL